MALVFGNVEIDTSSYGSGVLTRNPVRVATIISGTLSVDYAAGQTIDGIVLKLNDRILIKDQTNNIENGIYYITAGTPIRSPDFDIGSKVGGVIIIVKEGLSNADTIWTCTNDTGSDTVDTDPLSFIKTSGGNGDVAGPGSSTNNAIVRFDGTTGKIIQNSGILIDDTNNITGAINVDINGYIEFKDISAPGNPLNGEGRLYKQTGDENIYWAPNSAGEIINLSRWTTNYRRTTVNTATYNILLSDDIIEVTYTTTGECTLTLPLIATIGKKIYTIIDAGGNAKKNTIYIIPSGSDTIIGENQVEILWDYNSLTLINNDSNMWMLI